MILKYDPLGRSKDDFVQLCPGAVGGTYLAALIEALIRPDFRSAGSKSSRSIVGLPASSEH